MSFLFKIYFFVNLLYLVFCQLHYKNESLTNGPKIHNETLSINKIKKDGSFKNSRIKTFIQQKLLPASIRGFFMTPWQFNAMSDKRTITEDDNILPVEVINPKGKHFYTVILISGLVNDGDGWFNYNVNIVMERALRILTVGSEKDTKILEYLKNIRFVFIRPPRRIHSPIYPFWKKIHYMWVPFDWRDIFFGKQRTKDWLNAAHIINKMIKFELQKHPNVPANRVSLLGYCVGGSATILSALSLPYTFAGIGLVGSFLPIMKEVKKARKKNLIPLKNMRGTPIQLFNSYNDPFVRTKKWKQTYFMLKYDLSMNLLPIIALKKLSHSSLIRLVWPHNAVWGIYQCINNYNIKTIKEGYEEAPLINDWFNRTK